EGPSAEVVEVRTRDPGHAVLRDDQRTAEPAGVGVNDDLVHLAVVAYVEFVGLVAEGGRERARPASLADLLDQVERLGVEAHEVAVDVDARRTLPLRCLLENLGPDLAGVEVAQDEGDLFLVRPLGNVHAECVVLDEAAVLALGGLVRAETAPLRGVKVARLEVRLAPGERARDPPQVADGGHVAGPVEHLADAGAAADPVAGGQRVDEPLGEKVRADRARDSQVLLPCERPFELVLEVLEQQGERDPEQVLHQVAGELQTLVRVVVLVVLAPDLEVELEYGSGHAREVERLLQSVRPRVAKVGEERAVEDAVDLALTVLLGLSRGELLLEKDQGVLGREDPLGRVELLRNAFLEVDVQEMLHRLDERLVQGKELAQRGLEDLLVVLHPERFHQDDERDLAAGGRDRDLEDPVLLLLDDGEGAVAAPLAEHLRALDRRAVPLVVLREDPVGGQVLEADDHAFRAADDEVTARVERVLTVLDELRAVLLVREPDLVVLGDLVAVEVARPALDHDRQVADVNVLGGALDAVLDDRDLQEDRRLVREVAEAGLHRSERGLRPDGLLDERRPDEDRGLGGRV